MKLNLIKVLSALQITPVKKMNQLANCQNIFNCLPKTKSTQNQFTIITD